MNHRIAHSVTFDDHVFGRLKDRVFCEVSSFFNVW